MKGGGAALVARHICLSTGPARGFTGLEVRGVVVDVRVEALDMVLDVKFVSSVFRYGR